MRNLSQGLWAHRVFEHSQMINGSRNALHVKTSDSEKTRKGLRIEWVDIAARVAEKIRGGPSGEQEGYKAKIAG